MTWAYIEELSSVVVLALGAVFESGDHPPLAIPAVDHSILFFPSERSNKCALLTSRDVRNDRTSSRRRSASEELGRSRIRVPHHVFSCMLIAS